MNQPANTHDELLSANSTGHERARPVGLRACFLAVALLAAPRAEALQPLEDFLAGARRSNPASRQAALTADQRTAEATASLGSLLPGLSASASLTRNERAVSLDMGGSSVTLQPLDQLTGAVSLSTQVVDAAGWAHLGASRATADAARATAASTALQVEGRVAAAYYQVLGAAALVSSRTAALAAAEEDLALTRSRRAEGAATVLDVSRAEAEVESVRQSLADARLTESLARRSLATLTGLAPEAGAPSFADDLREEAPLEWWQRTSEARTPSLVAAAGQRRATEAQATAATLGLLPTLSASATQHFTNAGGLTGQTNYRTLTANLTWSFDLGTAATIRARSAAAEAARASEEATVADVRDVVHEQWQRVATGLVKCRSARAQEKAATQAAEVARERYTTGAGTQLELIQAERDQLAAATSRVQADADLAVARAALRLAAGLASTVLPGASENPIAAPGTAP